MNFLKALLQKTPFGAIKNAIAAKQPALSRACSVLFTKRCQNSDCGTKRNGGPDFRPRRWRRKVEGFTKSGSRVRRDRGLLKHRDSGYCEPCIGRTTRQERRESLRWNGGF